MPEDDGGRVLESKTAVFWLPGSRRRRGGTYEIGADGGVEITVFGALRETPPFLTDPIPVLLGEVAGKPVTCVDVWPRQSSAVGTRFQKDRFWVTTTFEGARWHCPATQKHYRVGLRLSELDGWVHQRGIEPVSEGLGWRHAEPSSLTAHTGVGEVSIQTSASERFSADVVTMRTVHSVWWDLSTPLTALLAWQSVVMPIQALLSVASMGSVGVTELWFAGRSIRSVPVLERAHRAPSEMEPKHFYDFLFTTANWNVATNLPKWLDLWNQAQVAITTFTAAYSSGGYVMNSFLSTASAIEALHAALHPELDEPSSRQTAKLERVLTDIQLSRDRSWAKSFLKTAHRPSLQQRLTNLAATLGDDVMIPLVRDPTAWAAKVADVRNAMTHSDPRSWPYQSDAELLVGLTETLRIVFLLTVLMQIGFDQPSVSALVRENRQLRHWLGRFRP